LAHTARTEDLEALRRGGVPSLAAHARRQGEEVDGVLADELVAGVVLVPNLDREHLVE
jgi:hypothetical protein